MLKIVKLFLVLLLVCCFTSLSVAQHADCSTMITLEDTVYKAKNITGYGKVREFKGYSSENIKFFEEEKNTIWYKIKSPVDGQLTFDILPDNHQDDWDFIVFEHKKMFCKRINAQAIEPIRSNLSRSSKTGLSLTATDEFVGAGLQYNYSKSITVNKDKAFVIVVNNPKQSGKSHTLKLHFHPKKDSLITTPKTEVVKPIIKFKLKVLDSSTNKELPSNMSISGLKRRTVKLEDVTFFETSLTKKNHTILVNTFAKGYMLTLEEIKVRKNKVEVSKTITLEPISANKKINLKAIQFQGNVAKFMPSARPHLESLYQFLKINNNIKVEIEGHVNGPNQPNKKEFKTLSTDRAKAVANYLIDKGISKSRLQIKGYGNTQMVYPRPKNVEEQTANRRVEVKIIAQ